MARRAAFQLLPVIPVRVLLSLLSDEKTGLFIRAYSPETMHGRLLTTLRDEATALALTQARSRRRRRLRPQSLPLTRREGERVRLVLAGNKLLQKQVSLHRLHFASFRLADLLVAQPWVRARQEPAQPFDTDDLVDVCMRACTVPYPSVHGDELCFAMDAPESFSLANVTAQSHGTGDMIISVRVAPRPNIMTVSQYDDAYVITNGHHRALALKHAGVEQAIFALRGSDENDDTFRNDGFADLATLLRFLPMLEDYLDDTLAPRVMIKPIERAFVLNIASTYRHHFPKFEEVLINVRV